MKNWVATLSEISGRAEPCVLVTVAGIRGSAPRECGAKMIVTATEAIGTIGGGQLEYQCIRSACEWLQSGAAAGGRTNLRRIALGANCGQCCGGVAEVLFEEITVAQSAWIEYLAHCRESATAAVVVTARQSRARVGKLIVTETGYCGDGNGIEPTADLLALARRALRSQEPAHHAQLRLAGNAELPVLIEPVRPADFRVIVFGAGHVGVACVNILSTLDAQIDVVDSRPGFVRGGFADNVHEIETSAPAAVVDSAQAGCFYLVMTHDHGLDFEICERILRRGDFAFCGLIGSRTKRRRFEKRLRVLGLSETAIASLTCPIGSRGIAGKKPTEIAVSVAAQLLELKEQGMAIGFAPEALTLSNARPARATGGSGD